MKAWMIAVEEYPEYPTPQLSWKSNKYTEQFDNEKHWGVIYADLW